MELQGFMQNCGRSHDFSGLKFASPLSVLSPVTHPARGL